MIIRIQSYIHNMDIKIKDDNLIINFSNAQDELYQECGEEYKKKSPLRIPLTYPHIVFELHADNYTEIKCNEAAEKLDFNKNTVYQATCHIEKYSLHFWGS